MNKYYLTARLAPSILTSIPICTTYYYFLKPVMFSENYQIKWIGPVEDVSILSALIFLLVQINRFLSKEIFQKFFFKEDQEMPTTKYLMCSESFLLTQIKVKLRNKIKDKFDIELYNFEKESENEPEAKKLIVTAVSQIRNYLRGDKMILRHNIEYGFVRNLIGGSLFALLISFILFLISKFHTINHNLVWISIFLICFYSLPVILSGWLIKRFGHYYAKVLYEQFLSN
jgi:hypothetical protein